MAYIVHSQALIKHELENACEITSPHQPNHFGIYSKINFFID
jgi:hypothetical protein